MIVKKKLQLMHSAIIIGNIFKEEIRMERLKELLLQKEEYYNNVDLSEDEYYALVEIIDNIIINEFTVEEIDQAKKELNLD